MPKYRKKPVVVEAVRWTGSNLEEIRNFVGGYLIEECVELFDIKRTLKEMLVDIAIDTLEGTMRVDYGDYIIKGVQGEFYPCKPDIFHETYENLIDKNGEYEVKDEEISKLLTPQKPKTVWDLKDGDKCFKVHCNGAIEARNWNKNDDNLNKCRELGFIFLTKEEAEFEVERRKCEVIMLKHGTRDTVPENLEHVYKWTIGIDNKNKATHSNFIWRVVSSGTIWFATKELVHKTIEEIGEDRLKKYVLKV